ncbi:MAG: nuclear transport factor 2 family protein [Pyrinomonadaceae bacterium]|nr:nuclear transport factor 2 family protein [Pyrinomonadaceae bacterium]
MRILLILTVLVFASCSQQQASYFQDAEFENLMQKLADGWNKGDAKKAADCFTKDAVYTEPPDKQIYKGRDELFKFFGGNEGRKSAMKMTWHHLVYDEKREIGMGEFTFDYGGKVHGMVIVKIKEGKISNWREYWYESKLEWEKFTENNKF